MISMMCSAATRRSFRHTWMKIVTFLKYAVVRFHQVLLGLALLEAIFVSLLLSLTAPSIYVVADLPVASAQCIFLPRVSDFKASAPVSSWQLQPPGFFHTSLSLLIDRFCLPPLMDYCIVCLTFFSALAPSRRDILDRPVFRFPPSP